jgi:RNase P subunit RPR2
MIRIVCPHCHSPLSTTELEQVTIDGHLSLVCPECSSVLVSEPVESERLDTHETSCTVPTDAHA